MANVTPDIDSREDQDRAYAPDELQRREQAAPESIPGYDRSSDGLDDHPISAGDASGVEPDGAKIARDGENGAGGVGGANDINSSFTGKGKKSSLISKENAKKHGPVVGILLTLVGGTIGVAGLASPSFLLMQIKETLTGFADNATPALTLRTKFMLQMKANTVANGFQFSDADGKCNIRCKFGTMDNKLVKSFEALDWKVNPTENGSRIPGRTIIASLEAPDGTIIKSGQEFKEFMRSSKNLALLNRVINFRSSFYLNSIVKGLTNRLHTNKQAKVTGNNETEASESMKQSLGLDPDIDIGGDTPDATPDEEADRKLGTERSSDFKSKFKIGTGSVANIAGAVCGIYDVGRGMSLAVKAAKMSLYISVAFTVFNITDQIMAGDSPSPEAVNEVTSTLTSYSTNEMNADGTENSYNGMSFTDAKGYKSAAYLDNPGTLTPQEAVFAITSGTVGGFIGEALGWLGKSGSVQTAVIREMCSSSGQTVTMAGICAAEQVGGSAVPLFGNIVAAGACVVGNVAGGLLVSGVVGAAIGGIVSAVVSSELPDIANAKGGEWGDAAYSGTASFENMRFAAVGGSAATSSSAVSEYKMAVADETSQLTQIARLDAKETPFDVMNQYSFLGSLVRNLGVAEMANTSLSSKMSGALSLIPRSFGSIISPAGAAESDAAAYGMLYRDNCYDSGLASVGAACDAFGNPTYVMGEEELGADINTVLTYMENGQIDENGEPQKDSEYENYVEYCVERTIPIGESEIGITGDMFEAESWTEPEKYRWTVGERCLENDDMIKKFRTYTMDKAISDTIDNLYSNGTTGANTNTEDDAGPTEDQETESTEDTSTPDGSNTNGAESVFTPMLSPLNKMSSALFHNPYSNTSLIGAYRNGWYLV